MNEITLGTFVDQLTGLVTSVMGQLPPATIAAALFTASHAVVTGAEIDLDEFSASMAAITAELDAEYEQRRLH